MRGGSTKQRGLMQRGDVKLAGNPDEVMEILSAKRMPISRQYSEQPVPGAGIFLSEYDAEVAKLAPGIDPPCLPGLGAAKLNSNLS